MCVSRGGMERQGAPLGTCRLRGVPCGHIGAPGKSGCWRESLGLAGFGNPAWWPGGGVGAGGREAFRLSGNVNFTPGYFLWDLFLGELETLPNYVWVSFKAHKLHPVLLPPS